MTRQHGGPQLDELPTEAIVAIQAGRRVEAVRIVRERTGLGLSEAKHLVDRAAGAYGAGLSTRKVNAVEDSGTLRLVAVLVLLGGVAAAWLLL